MYQLLIISVFSSVVVSATVDVNPVASSFAVRNDGQQPKGFDFNGGYSKKSGYNKVVVTTYVMPKMVPAASYSTYIIHPVGVTPCGFSAVDSESAPSIQKVEIKTEDVPMNGFGVEDHTMDHRVIATYAMNAQTINDNAMDGQVMEGHAMKGYVMEGHAMNGYVVDGYEEGDVTEEETRQSKPQILDKYDNSYENIIATGGDDQYKDWYKKDLDRDDYWEKIKKQMDTYYEEQYQKFLNDQHPYESNTWNSGLELQPTNYGFKDDNGNRFSEFQPKMDYIPKYRIYDKGVSDYKSSMPFIIRYDDDYDKGVSEYKHPVFPYTHGYEVHDKRFDENDAFGIKNGYRFSNGDFENGFGLQDKYEPKWR